MSGVSREICLSNLQSVALTVLELLAFNKLTPKNLGGHVTLATRISGTAHEIFSLGC